MADPMQPPEDYISVDQYLAIDEATDIKFEYHAGRIFAMSGSDYVHNRITFRAGKLLDDPGGGCEVVTHDQRVYVENPDHDHTYPDVVVTCGEPLFHPGHTGKKRTLLNPTLLIEVLSLSTTVNDYGWKLQAYMQIESLREYWIVDPDKMRIIRYIRRGDLWKVDRTTDPDAILEGETYRFPLHMLFQDSPSR